MKTLHSFFLITLFIIGVASTQASPFSSTSPQSVGFNEKSPILSQSGSQITLKSAFSGLPSWGHYPVIITLRNDSNKDQAFSLKTVSTSSSPNYYGRTGSEISTKANFALSCPAGSETSFDLLIPLAMASYGINNYGFSHSNTNSNNNSLEFNFTNNKDKFSTAVTGFHFDQSSIACSKKTYPGFSSLGFSDFNLIDFSMLPDSLLGMAGIDDIYLSEQEWITLDKRNTQIILKWIKQGGHLVILFEQPYKKILPALQKSFPNLSPKRKTKPLDLENGKVFLFKIDPKKAYVIDVLSQTKQTKLSKVSLETLTHNSSLAGESKWPVQEEMGTKSFGTIPIIILLVIFTILVGPINFFVIAKQGWRHRLIFTTPLISLGMSLILIAFIVFKDGFGGSGKRVLLREINHENKTCHLIQEQFSRTGMLMGSSFDLDNNLYINQVPIASSQWSRVSNKNRSSSEDYTITKGESKSTYTGNYFSSRSEHGHLLTGTQSTQESISVNPSGNGYSVTSTLKETLETLFINIGDEHYRASNVTTGNTVKLEASDLTEKNLWLAKQNDKFSKPNRNILTSYASRKNSFVAFSHNSEGIDSHPSIDWQTEAIITGIITTNTAE